MRRIWSLTLGLGLGLASSALAADDDPFEQPPPASAPAAPAEAAKSIDPPGIDYPALQAFGARSSLYIDHTYEYSNDLSTFYWVRGRAAGDRIALGGTLRLGGFHLNVEVPILITRLYIDQLGTTKDSAGNTVPAVPAASNRMKSAFSLGDVVGGASYAWDLSTDSITALVGLGLRVRLPSHTMTYSFSLESGGFYNFGFPYYFHLAPAAIGLFVFGPISLTINEGVLAMLAKNTTLLGVPLDIPNVYFWESHYAMSVLATSWLGLSVELISCVQLSHIDAPNFQALNQLKAFYINPGVTFDIGQYRLALAGRLGLGKDTERFGVITFAGSQAFLARLSYLF
jgi:hypothetical protein